MMSLRALLLSFAVLCSTGCQEPTAPPSSPGTTNRLTLFMVLDPDAMLQVLTVEASETGGQLEDVAAEVYRIPSPESTEQGVLVASARAEPTFDRDELHPCIARYGILDSKSAIRCLRFAFDPEPGVAYRVVVRAAGRPTASATTRVPQAFRILDATASGKPPRVGELRARWTESGGAYRYFVALRPAVAPRCPNVNGCSDGWYASTERTEVSAHVPEGALKGEGQWLLDVYAVDRALHEYLSTGSGGALYPVPPVQNVTGGYGAVGSWLRRSVSL